MWGLGVYLNSWVPFVQLGVALQGALLPGMRMHDNALLGIWTEH